MEVFNGKGVCDGIAIGRISFLKQHRAVVQRTRVEDPAAEQARFEQARDKAAQELSQLYRKALREVGETNAGIFDIHRMMLEDEDYNESVENLIHTQRVNAEYAVAVTSDNFADMFSSMDSEYMRARAQDVRDVSNRLIRLLSGGAGDGVPEAAAEAESEGRILCADDLTPSETVQLDKTHVLAFVTRHGSANSHTAILARTMGIPAVVGVKDLTDAWDGQMAAVDGFQGIVYMEPDRETTTALLVRQEEAEKYRARLRALKGKENRTRDGRTVQLYANIGAPEDIGAALFNDAGGIGLFRSEFLYLRSDDYPSELTQYAAYRKILESMAGKKVIIRTLDIGADKQIGYFGLGKEENPALGYRAIRICLTRPDIFKTQLRALYRASVCGNLAIMFPMITSLKEVLQIREIIAQVKAELTAEGFRYADHVEIGIMIETPAAALISDRLAPEVDFFSVGTNDLIQYTLACDRQNPLLEPFCDTHHEAILRLIGMATEAAHRHGKWIGICGELGSDTSLTEQWLRMGIDELSVSPSQILRVREKIRSITVE